MIIFDASEERRKPSEKNEKFSKKVLKNIEKTDEKSHHAGRRGR